MGKICDVSKYQGNIDWCQASKELDMVIIRVQYGSKVEDEFHEKNAQGAKENRVPFGQYAFGHYISVDDAKVEANDFLSRINPDAKFLVLDVENPTIDSCGKDNVAEATQAFIDVCKQAGHKIGLYISSNLYKQYGLDKVVSDFLWIPSYGINDGNPHTKPAYPCDLWQFTSVGRLSGVQGNADLSQLNGDKDLAWFIGKVNPPTTPPQPKPKKDTVIKKIEKVIDKIIHHNVSYSVKPGDTLSEIAVRFNTTVSQLVKDNNIKDPSKIYVGQLLHVGTTKTVKHSAPSNNTYIVKKCDSLSKIASDHHLTLVELEKLNPQISNPNVISIGQKINVSGNVVQKKIHTVKSGETLTKIAHDNNMSLAQLEKLNPQIKDFDVLKIGEKINLN